MNVSMSEIIVILLIALLVIKPEQLPTVALTIGRFVQFIRRLFTKMKNEMDSLIESVEKTHVEKLNTEKSNERNP